MPEEIRERSRNTRGAFRRHSRTVAVLSDDSRVAANVPLTTVGGHRPYRLEGESRLVGGRRPVAAYTEVPIGDAGGALASGCLGRSGCVANGIEQLDDVLLVLLSRTQARYTDVERAVLPEDVVIQNRVRERRAARMTRRAADWRHEGRRQQRRIGRACHPGRLRAGCRVRPGGPAHGAIPRGGTGQGRSDTGGKNARGGEAIVVHDGVVDDFHVQRVLQRYSRAVPTRHVVDDDVVGNGHVVPEWRCRLIGGGIGNSTAGARGKRVAWVAIG